MISIHMVPAYATEGGLTLARSLSPAIQTISRHLAEATERCVPDGDALKFHTNPALLNADLFQKTALVVAAARTTLENTRHRNPRITKYEHEFFRGILKNVAGTIDRLSAEAHAAPSKRRSENPWMSGDVPESKRQKIPVTFGSSSPLPTFFGLELAALSESVFLAAGFKNGLSYEKRVANRVGVGAALALGVYEGDRSLVTSRTSLLPHRAYRAEDMISRRRGNKESRRFYVASSYLPVLYSAF